MIVRKKRLAARSARPKPPALQRQRRQLPEITPSVPSTLTFRQKASSAESGHEMIRQHHRDHGEEDTDLTGGDVDGDWEAAYSDGDEAPGGDNSNTPSRKIYTFRIAK